MTTRTFKTVALCLAIASAGTCAFAEETAGLPAAAPIGAGNPLGAKVLDATALARQRGGTDPGTLSDMKLNGVVGSNNASNLTTGNNAITDGAFTGVNGVPLVVQNSGNNVLIQSATIINVQLK